jgi:hypothetical protein
MSKGQKGQRLMPTDFIGLFAVLAAAHPDPPSLEP